MDRIDDGQPHSTPAGEGSAGDGGACNRGEAPPCRGIEHDAFTVLVDQHRPELLRYARRQLGSRAQLAEDVIQEAFLNAYRHLAAGRRPQNTRAWLFAIVHNAAINVVRSPQCSISLEAHHIGAGALTPTEMVEQREWMDWLMGAIGTLPPRQRDALVGHAIEGHSYRELASRQQTTVSAIKTLVHRARRNLIDAAPLSAIAAPLLLVSRRLAGLTHRRALAGKLSAKGIAGMLTAAVGTATVTTGLLLAVHTSHSAATVAVHRHLAGASAGAHKPPARGRRAPKASLSPTARLHREARRATAECVDGRRPDRRLRVPALQYAATHLTTVQIEYTDCEQALRGRAMQIVGARGHRQSAAPARR